MKESDSVHFVTMTVVSKSDADALMKALKKAPKVPTMFLEPRIVSRKGSRREVQVSYRKG